MNGYKSSRRHSIWIIALVAIVAIFLCGRQSARAVLCCTCITNCWPIAIPQDVNNQDDDDSDCDPPTANDGPQGGDSPCGMPEWRVSPLVNLWLHDTPLRYRLSNGKWMELKLSYKHRVEWEDRREAIGGFGQKWECNWIGLLEQNNQPYITNYLAGGGLSVFATNGAPEYHSGRRLAQSDGSGGGGESSGSGTASRIHSPTGSQNRYGSAWSPPSGDRQFQLRNKSVDRYGRSIDYEWETDGAGARLKHVFDRDGRSCSFAYTNSAFPNLITSVTDPYGRSAYFIYNAQGLLTTIIDMAGMSSSFTYDGDGRITTLQTPYGNTGFSYFDAATNSMTNAAIMLLDRAIEITEANGSKQLYAYRDQGSVTNGGVVTNVAGVFACNDPQYFDRNSYHWNRQQYPQISTTGLADYLDMPMEDYWKASVEHLLKQNLAGRTMLSGTPSDIAGPVLQPTLNAVRSGQSHFDYSGASPTFVGPQKRITKVVQGNLTYFSPGITTAIDIGRNDWGRPISFTYNNGNGSATYYNTYDADGRVLQTVTGPRGEMVRGYGYDEAITNLLTSVTNALDEVVRYTHASGLKVSSITYPSGLVTTNIYYTSGSSTGFLAKTIDIGFRTNAFSYANGNVYIQTNGLGLVTTNVWDGLNRLSATHFPDGTYASNLWDKLDLAGQRDRLGFWTRSKFNAVRQLVAVTNANGAVTEYQYCGCGSPSQITAWNGATALTTTFAYDLAGRMISVTHPDSYQLSYTYDDLERILTVLDNGGHQVEFAYNDFDQITAVKVGSGAGQRHWALRQFDEYGRLTSSTDRNGVRTTISSYDFLDRALERQVIGAQSQNYSGVEYFEYDARGLARYTDALGKVTQFARDALSRTLYETNANLEVLRFTYNSASQLLTLTDGNANTTRWKYDAEGRVTNKVDAASAEMFRYQYDPNARLTNRWQAGNIATTFRYDAVGNLTNIVYPSSSNVALRYDALNRLTNLVDGVGTNTFTWTGANQLASEDGPWASDTVSFGYASRQRSSLSLQQPNASPWSQNYGFDAYRRLTNVISAAGAFSTQYKDVTAGSDSMAADLIAQLALPGGSAITNDFDDLGRLLSTVLQNAGQSTLNSHSYQLNEGHQRTRQTFPAGNYLDYTYDDIGQLKTATGWESDTVTPRQHEQFGYAYDQGWNLNRRTNNALVQTFGVNNLNELTTATRTGNMTVAGNTTTAATSVTLNSAIAELYGDNAFARTNVSLANGANTFTAIAENAAGLKDTNIIAAYLPTSVTFSYDARGNLTNDGRRVFNYDDENQLTSVTVSNAWRSEFAYDGLMRRRIRKEYTWQSSAWILTNEFRYIYDGRLVIQERDTNNAPTATYTRGNDLSGTLQGAGGIGGLLARTAPLSTLNPQLSSAYYHCDGNGNITALVNPSGNRVAQYHHDPYGNLLELSGPLADANLYRFSSKEWHANAGIYHYGFRYYEPNLQRWPNRDPLGDIGSLALMTAPWAGSDNEADEITGDEFIDAWTQVNGNLYGGIGNDLVNRIDPVGLQMGCATLAAEPALLLEGEALAAYNAARAVRAAKLAAATVAAASTAGDRSTMAGRRETGVKTTTGGTKADEKAQGGRRSSESGKEKKAPQPPSPKPPNPNDPNDQPWWKKPNDPNNNPPPPKDLCPPTGGK